MPRNWEEAYRAAVLETDGDKLANRIDWAMAVLGDCLREIGCSGERQRIEDAVRMLDLIRRTELATTISVTDKALPPVERRW
jgi:hypothetical protein